MDRRDPHIRSWGTATALAALAFATLGLAARADAQTIVNTAMIGNQATWLTSWTTTGNDGTHPEGRHVRLSLLVEHPRGRKVTGLKIDQDWDTADESASSPTMTAGLDVEQPNVAGGFNYSRVNYDFLTTSDATPEGVDQSKAALHVRAVLDDGSVSAPVSSLLVFVSASNIPNYDQPPFLYEAGPFFSSSPLRAWGFTGRDPDPRQCRLLPWPLCTSRGDLAGIEWRTRNQLTGATTKAIDDCANDLSDDRQIVVRGELPDRGTFTVEGDPLGGAVEAFTSDVSCDSHGWGKMWPIASIDVNSSSIPPPVLAIGPRPVVGGNVAVSAQLPADPDVADGGRVQYAEWDLDGNPSNGTNGFDVAQLGSYKGFAAGTFLLRTIHTDGMTPGLKTVRVRLTDNGAMSGADDVRATSAVATIQYRVDSPPVIAPASLDAAVDAPASVPLSATDADGDPIAWSVTDGPDHGSGSLTDASGTSNNYDYLPDPGYAGTDSVTLRVADGWGGTSTRTIPLRYHPETTIDSASPEALTQETDAVFTFTSNVASALFQCRLTRPGGQEVGLCTSPAGWSSLPDGDYRFEVTAIASDRTASDQTSAIYEWTIDTTPEPPVPPVSPEPPGSPEQPGSSEPPDSPVAAAPPVQPLVDVDPPETKLTKGAPKRTHKSKVKFTFVSDEVGSTFECKQDRKPWTPCASPTKVKGLGEGKHRFGVRAIDAAGNVDPTPAKNKFRVVGE